MRGMLLQTKLKCGFSSPSAKPAVTVEAFRDTRKYQANILRLRSCGLKTDIRQKSPLYLGKEACATLFCTILSLLLS